MVSLSLISCFYQGIQKSRFVITSENPIKTRVLLLKVVSRFPEVDHSGSLKRQRMITTRFKFDLFGLNSKALKITKLLLFLSLYTIIKLLWWYRFLCEEIYGPKGRPKDLLRSRCILTILSLFTHFPLESCRMKQSDAVTHPRSRKSRLLYT